MKLTKLVLIEVEADTEKEAEEAFKLIGSMSDTKIKVVETFKIEK